MRKYALAAMVMAALLALGCAKEETPLLNAGPPESSTLTERWHTLDQMENVWNERSIVGYDALLDEDFTFFFALVDVDNGLPIQWDRATEIGAARNMFDPNYTGERRITDIDLDLQFKPEDLEWSEFDPADAKYDGETWYRTTVNYGFTFEADPDWMFINQRNSKAGYTIRQTNGKWRVVEMHDLGGGSLRSLAMSGAVEKKTWGGIKALYKE